MREYDDDSNIQHYAPVLRRIIILVAVITAVPVMLWTITAFMHTYIAQPTIPAPRPLAAATALRHRPALLRTRQRPILQVRRPHRLNPRRRPPTAPAMTAARPDARSAGNNAAPNVQAPPPPLFRRPSAGSQLSGSSGQAAPAAPAPSVFPDPPSLAPQQPTPAAADSANDADALPPPDPITGPVPLPRHRPSVLALADTAIPLPRARPGTAPEPATPTPDAPPSGYDPGIGH